MTAHRHLLLAAALACASIAASAEEAAPAQRELLQPPRYTIPGPITDRLAVRGIVRTQDISTRVRYDDDAGVPGTLLAVEDQLGVPDALDQGTADLMFRMLDRHRIRVDYQQQVRNGDTVTAIPIRFGDATYLASERVLTHLDLRRFGMTYTYSLVRNEKFELGAGIGIHLLQAQGELEAPARFVREQEDVAGAFPTLATDMTWQFARRLSLNGAVQFLGGNVNDVSAGYLAWNADVQFRAFRNLAVGAGWAMTRYRIDSSNEDASGYFRLKYQGPQFFLRVSY